MGQTYSYLLTPSPTIRAKEGFYRIHKLSTVEMTCDVCYVQDSVWKFRSQNNPDREITIKDSGKYTIKYTNNPDTVSLKIRRVTDEDQGTYTCEVTNRSGLTIQTSSDEMRLEVICIMETFRWNDESQKDDIMARIRRAPFTTNSGGIILYGLVSAGKSSFSNSVQTAITGIISTPTSQGPCRVTRTTKVSYIKIADLPVTIIDTKGFNRVDSSDDLLIRDIMLNRVPDGTEHDAWKSGLTTDAGCMENPTWCVVYVHNCMDTDVLPENFYDRIREQERRVRELGFHMVILLTNIDQLEGNEELSEIYIDNKLRKVMEALSRKTHVDVMNIYPVQNYSAERKTIVNMDILLLNAVRCMLDRMEDSKKLDRLEDSKKLDRLEDSKKRTTTIYDRTFSKNIKI